MAKNQEKCTSKKIKYTTALLLSQVAYTLLKVLKSFTFNIIVFLIGFGLGYIIISKEVHYHATHHELYQYVAELNTHLNKLDEMDEEYFKANRQVKFILQKMAADLAHERHTKSKSPFSCETEFGKKIWK